MKKTDSDWLHGKGEIADHCRVSVETLTAWARKYTMPITIINRQWYARRSLLNKWLDLPHEKR